MFEKGFQGAYYLAGRSYFDSEHYDLSSSYFSKALKMDPPNLELQFLLNFSLGMNAYYKNAYSKVLSYFWKLIHLKLDGKFKKDCIKKMEEVCHKIAMELQEEKRLKIARKAYSLVDQIKKML